MKLLKIKCQNQGVEIKAYTSSSGNNFAVVEIEMNNFSRFALLSKNDASQLRDWLNEFLGEQ